LQDFIDSANDIDMQVSAKLANELIKKYDYDFYNSPVSHKSVMRIHINERIEAFIGSDAIKGALFVDGIPVANPEFIRDTYAIMGREKDKEKIKMLTKWLAKHKKEL